MDTPVQHNIRLHLLSTFALTMHGEQVEGFRSDKVRALLAYLAIEGDQFHRRTHLASLFWGEFTEASARSSLRQALVNLRKVLSVGLDEATSNGKSVQQAKDALLVTTYNDVALNPSAGSLWVDAIAFDMLVKACQIDVPRDISAWASCIPQLEAAAELYQGDVLRGLNIPDCPEFEKWRYFQQEIRFQQAQNVFDILADYYLSTGNTERAKDFALRQLSGQPWQEKPHCQMMQALAMEGHYGAAIQQFEECERQLKHELGIEPHAETLALYQKIRTKSLNGDRSAPAQIVGIDIEAKLPPNPYPGLRVFRAEDATTFFGREVYISQLVSYINEHRVTGLIGESGSGKSSLVNAGVIPRLYQDEELRDLSGYEFQILNVRPGNNPFGALADTLLSFLEPELPTIDYVTRSAQLADSLASNQVRLSKLLSRQQTLQEKSPAEHSLNPKRIVLIIDQLEELFAFANSPEECQVFVDQLLGWALANDPNDGHSRLLLVLRADYTAVLGEFRQLADAISHSTLLLSSMNEDELRQVIQGPAEQLGVQFEVGLIDRILSDVGNNPGRLPSLQFAMSSLWQRQATGRQLTHKTYTDIGAVSGALSDHATSVYKTLSSQEQNLAKQVLTSLVRVGVKTQDTRRQEDRQAFSDEEWSVAAKLVQARLLVTNADSSGVETIELAHEALIANWSLLQAWLQDSRGFRIWKEGYRRSVDMWLATDHHDDALTQGVLLAEAERWYQQFGEMFSTNEILYIEASREKEHRQILEADAQRRQQLEQVQALAKSERLRADEATRARRLLRWAVLSMIIILLLALWAGRDFVVDAGLLEVTPIVLEDSRLGVAGTQAEFLIHSMMPQ